MKPQKTRSRFNQYTGPQMTEAQKQWNEEAYLKLNKLAKKWAKPARR